MTVDDGVESLSYIDNELRLIKEKLGLEQYIT